MADKEREAREYPQHSVARDEKADPSEEAAVLQDNLIGQKATPDGTAHDDTGDVPTGQAARDGKAPEQR